MKDYTSLEADITALKAEAVKLHNGIDALQVATGDWMKGMFTLITALTHVIKTHKTSIAELQKTTKTLMSEREMRQVSMFDNILLGTPDIHRHTQ